MVTNARALAATATLILVCTHAQAQTAFTYQGQLKQGGVPLNGTADFEFQLWDACAGNPVITLLFSTLIWTALKL